MGDPPVCLVVASADPTGGAGMQADSRAFAAAGCFATTVVTAVTMQNGYELHGRFTLPDDIVLRQLTSAFEAHKIRAVKLGSLMISGEVARLISAYCGETNCTLVVDPVLVTASGAELCSPNEGAAILEILRGVPTVVTPNATEAAILARHVRPGIHTRAQAAEIIADWLMTSVVVTSGDQEDGIDVVFTHDGRSHRIGPSRPPVDAEFVHGAGCTYAALLTAALARGAELSAALESAKHATEAAVHAGVRYAQGVVTPFADASTVWTGGMPDVVRSDL